MNRKKLLTAAAVVIVAAASNPALAASGLPADQQLLPFANFVLLWLSFILISVAGVAAACSYAFADRLGMAAQKVGNWLIGACFIGGIAAGGSGWAMTAFGISQGALL